MANWLISIEIMRVALFKAISLALTFWRHSITLLMYVLWQSYGGKGKFTGTPFSVNCCILHPFRLQANPLSLVFAVDELQQMLLVPMFVLIYPIELLTSASRRLSKHISRFNANSAYFLFTSFLRSTDSELGQISLVVHPWDVSQLRAIAHFFCV